MVLISLFNKDVEGGKASLYGNNFQLNTIRVFVQAEEIVNKDGTWSDCSIHCETFLVENFKMTLSSRRCVHGEFKTQFKTWLTSSFPVDIKCSMDFVHDGRSHANLKVHRLTQITKAGPSNGGSEPKIEALKLNRSV
ncbi:unnamed protein product [Rhodiola kirilowii]